MPFAPLGARRKRYREIRRDAATESFDTELRAGVARDVEIERAGVRLEVVPARRLDGARIGDVSAHRLGTDVLRLNSSQGHFTADAARLKVSGDVPGTQVTTDGFGAEVPIHLRSVCRAGDGFDADRPHAIADVHVATYARRLDLALGASGHDITGDGFQNQARSAGNADVVARLTDVVA